MRPTMMVQLGTYITHTYDVTQYQKSRNVSSEKKLYYFPAWDKLLTLDSHHNVTDTGSLELASILPAPHYHKPIYSMEHEFPFDSAEYVPHVNQLLVSSANNIVLHYELESVESGKSYDSQQKLVQIKKQYTQGRMMVMKWDQDAQLLFCGSHTGVLTGMKIEDNLHQLPTIMVQHQPHTQSIIDLLTLPTVGAKRIVTAGLDSKAFINEIQTERVIAKELGSNTAVNSMTFCDAHGVIVTTGWTDACPSMWTPVAAKNQLVAKFVDASNPHKGRILRVGSFPGTPHLVTADTFGMVKIWDIRKLQPAQTFFFEDLATLNAFDFVLDVNRNYIISASKCDIWHKLYFHRQESQDYNKPTAAHDTDVVGVCFHRDTQVFLTCTSNDVAVWDANTGI
eukprot:PhF_6_TR26725/c0_g1_i4/m.39154